MDTQHSILIVEDDSALRQALETKLLKEGFDVKTAVEGNHALQEIERHHFDLILLDVIMPYMDGLTMLKILREREKDTKPTPVLMLTNQNDMEMISDAVEAQVAGYLIKSNWTLDKIVQEIHTHLGTGKTTNS
jgi:CheY-like chemotaxis protein